MAPVIGDDHKRRPGRKPLTPLDLHTMVELEVPSDESSPHKLQEGPGETSLPFDAAQAFLERKVHVLRRVVFPLIHDNVRVARGVSR